MTERTEMGRTERNSTTETEMEQKLDRNWTEWKEIRQNRNM